MSFKNELGKIKAAEEARRRTEDAIRQREEAANLARNKALENYSDQLSAYLNEYARPILEEVNSAMLENEGSIWEEKLYGNERKTAYMRLSWNVRQLRNYDGPDEVSGNQISLSIDPPYNLVLSAGDDFKDKTFSLKDGRWVEKVEKEIVTIFKDVKYYFKRSCL